MAAPLCKFLDRSGLRWTKLYDNAALAVMVRSFHCNPQRLYGRKNNRNRKDDNGFDDFIASSLAPSSSLKQKRKTSLEVEQDSSGHSQPLPLRNSSHRPPPFIQMIRERYRQACRSVVIRTHNPESTVRALSSFGPLKFAQCVSNDKQYLIAEFASESCVKKLQESSQFFFESRKFPLTSRCLFDESKWSNQGNRQKKGNVSLLTEENWHSSSPVPYPTLPTFDEELHTLSESRGLNDLDIRARFLACVMVEDLVRPMLPHARVIPYGSCLNGFGWWDSDLDMMICLQGDPYVPGVIKKPSSKPGLPTNFKFLTEVFHTERMLAQKSLTMVASLLELGPRFNNVYKILNAHVPIVRFHSATLNLQCDVSLEAMDSIKMTELLYLYSSLDSRVHPLMSCIKQWALSHGLTAGGEQQKPTTIGMLGLLVFFLQTRTPQILPTLRTLHKATAPSDMFYIDTVVYGIPSNPSILPKSQNSETLESLLHGFFLFYSEFDFENQAISIIEGSTFPKPADSSPLYLENPLCIGLNICKNVSSKHLEAFTDAMKVAARKVESLSETSAEAGSDNSLKVASPHGDGFQGSRLSYLFNCDIMDNQQNVNVEVLDLFEDDRKFENAAKEALKDSEVIKEGDKMTSGAETTGLLREQDSSLSEGGDTALHEKS